MRVSSENMSDVDRGRATAQDTGPSQPFLNGKLLVAGKSGADL